MCLSVGPFGPHFVVRSLPHQSPSHMDRQRSLVVSALERSEDIALAGLRVVAVGLGRAQCHGNDGRLAGGSRTARELLGSVLLPSVAQVFCGTHPRIKGVLVRERVLCPYTLHGKP